MTQQLFHFLESCSRQPALPLTNKGTLHKKQMNKLTEHVSLPSTILSKSGLKYAFTDAYDEPSAWLLEIAIRLGFLDHNEDCNGFLLNEGNVRTWLNASYKQQQGLLYHIWRQTVSPAPVWLQHAIIYMERTMSQQWYALDELYQHIQESVSNSYLPQKDTEIREELMAAWLSPLCIFRFLELGKDQHQGIWFHWLINPQQANPDSADLSQQDPPSSHSLYVQPDFEILLTPAASLHTEWEVAAFADIPEASDLVRTYRLTKESFQRALDREWHSADVIRVLQEHAYYEIPQGLIHTLQQWEEQKDKLYVEDVTLLRCKSADIADALLRQEKCRSYFR